LEADALKSTGDELREHLARKHRAREGALALSRDVIRFSANAIRAVHRKDFAAAETLVEQARANLRQAEAVLSDHPDIYHAGFIHDCAKEFVEASCTLALIARRPLPTPQDLSVQPATYLNGLAETIGELRRHLLDSLREGDMGECERSLTLMGDIYDVLITMDFPEAITAGLRRNTDAMRSILERTRGDFTTAYVQQQLRAKLEEFAQRSDLER